MEKYLCYYEPHHCQGWHFLDYFMMCWFILVFGAAIYMLREELKQEFKKISKRIKKIIKWIEDAP